MTKRVFAFAGLATFGFFAACLQISCSDDDSGVSNTAVDSGGRRDATPVVEDEGGSGSCLSTEPIDKKYPYKVPAAKQPGACTADELKAISDYFNDLGEADEVSIEAWQATVGEGCRACAFSDGTGESWTPVISIADNDLTVNVGGCIEIVSQNAECGNAYQQFNECALDACFLGCQGKTSAEFQACRQDEGVFTGPCKTQYDALVDACGSRLTTYVNACSGDDWTFEGPIKVACGGRPVDAGTDASDAGDAGADADAGE